ncbi:MAG: 4Fe-4S dicluster domain-containing protein [Pseudomonadota bacterium]
MANDNVKTKAPVETVKLVVDGREVEVAKGSYILAAAEKLGIKIPTLCYYRHVQPYAACRICTVEVRRGKRVRYVTACNYPVEEGLEVVTYNERIRSIRKLLVEFFLARCSKVKVLRELASELGIDESRFGKGEEGCILCGLCVRVCNEVVGAKAIAFAGRGIERSVTTPFEVDSDRCIGCGSCAKVCPTGHIRVTGTMEDKIVHGDITLGPNTAIYVPTMQAVPNKPVIDTQSCIYFRNGKCKICAKICPTEAIDHEMKDTTREVEVGSIIAATGFQLFDPRKTMQYGYGRFDNVITSLEFERMNCAAGSTNGKIVLADGSEPKSIGIIHCIGSRDKNYHEYCSRVCCMYALKFAHLVKEKTGAEVYAFYIDMRSFGKGYEEFYNRLLEEDVRFIRGKAASVSDFALYPEEEGKLVVTCEDTLLRRIRRVPVDMVVLCSAIEAGKDAPEVARLLTLCQSKDGFFAEKHPKLAPVSTATDGIFIAGCCQGPKDIPDTVAQASGAAAQAMMLAAKGKIEIDAATALIDEDHCTGCRICNDMCPYHAIDYIEDKKVSRVNEALCKGCGTCVAACPCGVIAAQNFKNSQVLAEIEGVLA